MGLPSDYSLCRTCGALKGGPSAAQEQQRNGEEEQERPMNGLDGRQLPRHGLPVVDYEWGVSIESARVIIYAPRRVVGVLFVCTCRSQIIGYVGRNAPHSLMAVTPTQSTIRIHDDGSQIAHQSFRFRQRRLMATRRLVIITGASRGFGRSLAVEAAKAWGSKAGGFLDMVMYACNHNIFPRAPPTFQSLIDCQHTSRRSTS